MDVPRQETGYERLLREVREFEISYGPRQVHDNRSLPQEENGNQVGNNKMATNENGNNKS